MEELASFHGKALEDHTTGVLRPRPDPQKGHPDMTHGVEQLKLVIALPRRKIVIGVIANLVVPHTTVCIFLPCNLNLRHKHYKSTFT